MNAPYNEAVRMLKGRDARTEFDRRAIRLSVARALRSVPKTQRVYVRFKLRFICEFPTRVRYPMARKKQPSNATHLEQLLEAYVEARIAKENEGGGDPEDFAEIAHNLLLARTDLREFLQILVKYAIASMQTQEFGKSELKKVDKLIEDLKRFPTGVL